MRLTKAFGSRMYVIVAGIGLLYTLIIFVHFTVTLNDRAEFVMPVFGSVATTFNVYTFVITGFDD